MMKAEKQVAKDKKEETKQKKKDAKGKGKVIKRSVSYSPPSTNKKRVLKDKATESKSKKSESEDDRIETDSSGHAAPSKRKATDLIGQQQFDQNKQRTMKKLSIPIKILRKTGEREQGFNYYK